MNETGENTRDGTHYVVWEYVLTKATGALAESAVPQFMTVAEIAKLTRQSSAKVYDDIAKGRLVGCRFGASVRVEVGDYRAYVAAGRRCEANA